MDSSTPRQERVTNYADVLTQDIFKLCMKINTKGKNIAFFNFAAHINKVEVIVAFSKEKYDIRLYHGETYVAHDGILILDVEVVYEKLQTIKKHLMELLDGTMEVKPQEQIHGTEVRA